MKRADFKGYSEIQEMLKELPKALTNEVWSNINYNRSKTIVARAKQTAPEGPTGNLVDSIGSVKLRRENLGTVWTGPQRRNGKKGFAGHLNEYGTKDRRLKKAGRRKSRSRAGFKGRMKKNPFMHRAFDQVKTELELGIAKDVGKIITRVMKKHAKTNPT